MADASPAHEAIVRNAARLLGERLDAAAHEVAVAEPGAAAEPDGPPDVLVLTRPVTLFTSVEPGEPVAAVEVSDAHTFARDRTRRFERWDRVATARHVLVVRADRAAAEHYARRDDHWLLRRLGPGDTARLGGLGVDLPVSDLYEGTGLADLAS